MHDLVKLIQEWAQKKPHLDAVIYLEDGERETARLSYGELDKRAKAIAVYLHDQHLVNTQVLLLYPPGIDFIISLIGCWYAGVIAVPVHCPKWDEFEKQKTLLNSIAEDADIAAVLTLSSYRSRLNLEKKVKISATDTLKLKAAKNVRIPPISKETIAYLQYTSGSTSLPKGAVVTHENLQHSIQATLKAWHYTKNSVTLNWAPHTHVYGLVCGILMPLYHGTPAILMPPIAFLQKPSVWLAAISKYQVTHSGCPNFGFDLCVNTISEADLEGINLKDWKVAVNGGDIVQQETLIAFANKFRRCGFQLKQFSSAYGMSELAGAIAVTPFQDIPKFKEQQERDIVSSGKLIAGLQAIAVDPDSGLSVPDGATGEIWLSGKSVAKGYWRRPEETRQVFNANVEKNNVTYFKTGDLGFILNQEIYLTGRLKEVIVAYGKKYYPLDLELNIAKALAGLQLHLPQAVFSREEAGKEVIIVVQEVPEETEETRSLEIIEAIRLAITRQFGLDIHAVILTPEGAIPKTGSGKLQRKKAQLLLSENTLPIVMQQARTRSLPNSMQESSEKEKFKALVAEVLKLEAHQIDLHASLSRYAFDSINMVIFTTKLNETYQLSLSPAVLYEYTTLAKLYEDLLAKNAFALQKNENNQVSNESTEVAIIGISGVFPEAQDVASFWDNLIQGRDCISEIPSSRWNWRDLTVQFGGFIDGLDEFDAAFFNISPHEAELIDPQQRVFLQIVWKTIEDAGYSSETLAAFKTGLFVGVFNHDYAELLQKNEIMDAYLTTGILHSMIANRISYLLNLSGPSTAIDTACSSSLVAIHQAVHAILQGDCDIAIAGGVNALITPTSFIAAKKASMLSPDGRCKTFDKNANGYVRSEGAGAIFLKKLTQAQKDGDYIYGVIKGTAVNHGGHVNTLTAPNPNAQAEVIIKACQRAEVAIESIQYIETHGTGTSLGDPIEINGLKKAFQQLAAEQKLESLPKQYCGLGALKTHIGHLESAAGIAGIIKIVLAMQHEIIPANLHLQELNPYIELADSPFYLIDKDMQWPKNAKPRRAGVSSFGFGGANAHVIVEEGPRKETMPSHEEAYLITLSGLTVEALEQRIKDLLNWLEQQKELPSIAAISYTLNAGRQHFAKRFCLIVTTPTDLKKQLKAPLSGEDLQEHPTQHKALHALRERYLQGETLDWSTFYGTFQERIPLPTYPFAKESHWIKVKNKTLHALIDENCSTSSSIIFSKSFTENELYLREHQVDHEVVLPGTVCLEMARAAAHIAFKQKVSALGNIQWRKPIKDKALFQPLYMHLSSEKEGVSFVLTDKDKTISYVTGNVYLQSVRAEEAFTPSQSLGARLRDAAGAAPQPERHPAIPTLPNSKFPQSVRAEEAFTPSRSLGARLRDAADAAPQPERHPAIPTLPNSKFPQSVRAEEAFTTSRSLSEGLQDAAAPSLNLEELKDALPAMQTSEAIYAYFKNAGLFYGPAFQVIQALHYDESQVLAELAFTSSSLPLQQELVLHPCILDGVLQTTQALLKNRNRLYLPYSIEKIAIYGPLPQQCYVYVTRVSAPENQYLPVFDIQVADSQGQILLAISGFTLCTFLNEDTQDSVDYYYPYWKEKPLSEVGHTLPDALLLLGSSERARKALQEVFGEVASDSKARTILLMLDESQDADLSNEEFIHKELENTYYLIQKIISQRIQLKSKQQIQLICISKNKSIFSLALIGFFKTLHQEYSNIACRFIEVQDLSLLTNELFQNEIQVRYDEKNIRYIKDYAVFSKEVLPQSTLQKSGVYLITGGLGGLGYLLATYLAEQYQAKLVLTGRSALTAQHQAMIAPLESKGATVIYLQTDIAKQAEVSALIAQTKAHYGALNGIIHAAGLTKDGLIIHKTKEDIAAVLAAKVYGTCYLHEATKQEPLDFFVLFSSVAAIFGNAGQSDYAYANCFLNEFALQREQEGFGLTVAINWPFWEEGGLTLSPQYQVQLKKTLGISPLSTQEGLNAFSYLLQEKQPCGIVLPGDQSLLMQALRNRSVIKTITPKDSSVSNPSLFAKTEAFLKKLIADTLKCSINQIEMQTAFEHYGIDSLMIIQLNERLDKLFTDLPKTLFFEYQTLLDLSHYFIEHHASELKELLGDAEVSDAEIPQTKKELSREELSSSSNLDIAIIGLAGRYPEAKNLAEFWENLKNGKDCIREIPKVRWEVADYFDTNQGVLGKTYSKWGGFLDGVDQFDPLFFNISPREAALIDPQERLFLETAWKTVEDAGYARKQLAGKKVGVYVGVMYGQYQLFTQSAEKFVPTNSVFASIANRVSYFFDFHGPSIALDTMCSSSLTAIHLACQSIKDGESELALAGGVNLSLHPNKYLLLSHGKFLSSEGHCRSFGQGGDGYVPGEGVGAVLLKPLIKALADKDHIYGVIKGSQLNHGGKTNGYTVPNPNAQAQLIAETYQKAQIDLTDVSYIEAHGTGTSLGDPIEIAGLNKAFAKVKWAEPCAIGSVKSNIGHCESAAGIAALTKVLLQLQHKTLVPSLLSETLNTNIIWEKTPFKVQQAVSHWDIPKNSKNNRRLAGISSFGAGGANAHLIIEEAPEIVGEKIALPTYPFAYQSYWYSDAVQEHTEHDMTKSLPFAQALVDKVHNFLMQQVGQLLKLKPQQIALETSLGDYGMDSVYFIELAKRIAEYYQIEFTPAVFYTANSIETISHYLINQHPNNLASKHTVALETKPSLPLKTNTIKSWAKTQDIDAPIAIIGIDGVFPQSDNIAEFWQHLLEKEDLITEIPKTRWDSRDYYGPDKSVSKWGGLINQFDQFDAGFFNISAREAHLMDPQQRLFLESTWKTIEDAGYNPLALSSQKVGVFVGVEFSEYQTLIAKQQKEFHGFIATGNSHSMIANRVSYFFDFHGPSESVDTACSSSLVAIHRALQAIRHGECTMAIAGGVSLLLSPDTLIVTSQLGALSPDGRCKTFDKTANGYVKGEGVASILLKPLKQAQQDGDHIYGVIRGSAVNHGGKAQSLTAPNAKAQSDLLTQVYSESNIDPDSITYLETHGTGTALGDPVEIEGLKLAFNTLLGADYAHCRIGLGSVKTNIGHLEPASGIAGLIKLILSMTHEKMPGILHLNEINPYIHLENTPFYIAQETQSWARIQDKTGQDLPLRAGVSSFGFGGTNAHVILEEGKPHQAILDKNQTRPFYLIVLSAKQEASLEQKILDLHQWLLVNQEDISLSALSFTLATGKAHFLYRCALVVSSLTELIEALDVLKNKGMPEYTLFNEGQTCNRQSPAFDAVYQSAMQGLKQPGNLAQYQHQLFIVADLYTKHYAIDWQSLYNAEAKQRISGLPAYPFIKQRYWYDLEFAPVSTPLQTSTPVNSSVSMDLSVSVLTYLRQLFSEILRIPGDSILVDETYEVYGVDSVLGLEITNRLEKDFGSISKTLLYERNRLKDLAQYFIKNHEKQLANLLSLDSTSSPDARLREAANAANQPERHPSKSNGIEIREPRSVRAEEAFTPSRSLGMEQCDIAIIGLSGTFPMANTMDEFWHNLVTGRDCVGEVPPDRWDYKDYPVLMGNKEKYFPHGGFIPDVDKFDPLFFNISPRDAGLMDPQERLFMQSVWSTLEDAGYTRKKLKQRTNNSVGVFAGVTYNFYPLFIAEEWQKGNRVPLDIQSFSVANRISYFLDLNGPSFVVDTACSSSLAAIHLACDSIRRGDCAMAIAGGVNLSLHPSKYHFLGSFSFMSEQGRCTSFAEGGTGYVPSEGVGSVLLKPLADAIADNDSIYGVIKGSSMNHGGKTSGYTVPNPNAQAAVILQTLQTANIDPRTITYIEAHGTGTALGDPIEIRGLQEAFETMTQEKQYCAIGSVKSNIGHLESAAGISQVAKVLLQMRHKQLVPTLHTEKLNPFIDFNNSPFYVQRELKNWQTDNMPLRAGVSSFGAGGTNVHMIIEEYNPPARNHSGITGPYLFLLSALNEDRLLAQVQQMHTYLQNHPVADEKTWLMDVCYTLQLGREHWASRLAIVASSKEELLQTLASYPNSQKDNVYINLQAQNTILPEQEAAELIKRSAYIELIRHWVHGAKIDWEPLYTHSKPNIISLPTYPFTKRRCWIPTKEVESLVEKPQEVSTEVDAKDWFYSMQWEKNTQTIEETALEGKWLIFSDCELGLVLQETLDTQAIYCFVGEAFLKYSDQVYYIDPFKKEDYQALFSAVYAEEKEPLKGVIYLCSAINTNADPSLALLYLFKAMIKHTWAQPLMFALISKLAQPVDDKDTVNFWQHHLWSLTRIFAAEQANYQVLLLDLEGKGSFRQNAQNIVNEIKRGQSKENHIAYRDNERYTLRFEPYKSQLLEQKSSWVVPNAALVTGGLGALGYEVAAFLITQGTKFILLTGTCALSAEMGEKNASLKRLEASGVQVKYVAVDVADKAKMQEVIQETQKIWHCQIDGVFHLAGVTTDNVPIAQMEEALWQQVLKVKVQGSLVLHELFMQVPLRAFVLFSSIAAVPHFGMAGLSAYAVANEFMNGLAWFRRSQQLPALSINWVAWSEKGMSHRHNHDGFLDAVGMASLSIKEGMALFNRMLKLNAPEITVCKILWKKFFQVNATAKKLDFFTHFITEHAAKKSATLSSLSQEEIIDLVAKLLAKALALEIHEMDAHTPFQQYGLDSIIGINYIEELSVHFPDTVAPTDLYRYPTLDQLTNFILEQVQGEEVEVDECIDLDQLNADQLNALLESELKNLEELTDD